MTTFLDGTHTVKDGSAKRSKVSSNFMRHGYKVCKHTFSFLYGLGVNHRVLNVQKHYQDEEMMVRVHKNSNIPPPNTMSFNYIGSLVAFLQQYAEQDGILLPGRIPGYKCDEVKLLPSNNRKGVRNLQSCHCIFN